MKPLRTIKAPRNSDPNYRLFQDPEYIEGESHGHALSNPKKKSFAYLRGHLQGQARKGSDDAAVNKSPQHKAASYINGYNQKQHHYGSFHASRGEKPQRTHPEYVRGYQEHQAKHDPELKTTHKVAKSGTRRTIFGEKYRFNGTKWMKESSAESCVRNIREGKDPRQQAKELLR